MLLKDTLQLVEPQGRATTDRPQGDGSEEGSAGRGKRKERKKKRKAWERKQVFH